MLVTKQAIIDKFGAAEVEQIGSKHLFIVTLQNNVIVLVSYLSIIGFERVGIWYITDCKYGSQLVSFVRSNRVHRLTENDFNSQLKLLGVTK